MNRDDIIRALDALEQIHRDNMTTIAEENWSKAIEALRAALANEFNPDWDAMAVMVEVQQCMAKRIEELESALAQPEQEPPCKTGSQCVGNKCERCAVQPEREWVGLTPEEAREISLANRPYVIDMVYALEAKLKEKNS